MIEICPTCQQPIVASKLIQDSTRVLTTAQREVFLVLYNNLFEIVSYKVLCGIRGATKATIRSHIRRLMQRFRDNGLMTKWEIRNSFGQGYRLRPRNGSFHAPKDCSTERPETAHS